MTENSKDNMCGIDGQCCAFHLSDRKECLFFLPSCNEKHENCLMELQGRCFSPDAKEDAIERFVQAVKNQVTPKEAA